MENEREASEQKQGAMFFYEVEGHLQKFSAFGRLNKYGLKSHSDWLCTHAFNYKLTASLQGSQISLISYPQFTSCIHAL